MQADESSTAGTLVRGCPNPQSNLLYMLQRGSSIVNRESDFDEPGPVLDGGAHDLM